VPNVPLNCGGLLHCRMKRLLLASAMSLPKTLASAECRNLTFSPSLVTNGLVQQTSTLAVWKSDVRSRNIKQKTLQILKYDKQTLLFIDNTLKFFLRSFPSQTMHAHSCFYLLQHFLVTRPSIWHSAEVTTERSALVRWVCWNLRLRPNVISSLQLPQFCSASQVKSSQWRWQTQAPMSLYVHIILKTLLQLFNNCQCHIQIDSAVGA